MLLLNQPISSYTSKNCQLIQQIPVVAIQVNSRDSVPKVYIKYGLWDKAAQAW